MGGANERFHDEALRRWSNLKRLQGRASLRQILEARAAGQAPPRSACTTEEIVAMLERIERDLGKAREWDAAFGLYSGVHPQSMLSRNLPLSL